MGPWGQGPMSFVGTRDPEFCRGTRDPEVCRGTRDPEVCRGTRDPLSFVVGPGTLSFVVGPGVGWGGGGVGVLLPRYGPLVAKSKSPF